MSTSADAMLASRWAVCEEEPGVILVDLGDEGRPDAVIVDPHRDLDMTDGDAARVAEHLVALHNAHLDLLDEASQAAQAAEPVLVIEPTDTDRQRAAKVGEFILAQARALRDVVGTDALLSGLLNGYAMAAALCEEPPTGSTIDTIGTPAGRA